jgi:phage-related baseplate assembly protein
MSSILDPNLAEPNFIDRDPAKITAEMIAQYERDTSKTLFPAQVERLLINNIAYRESLIRVAIQDAAKQNLVRYANAPMLDLLGELMHCQRLAATAATCTLQFTFDAPGQVCMIPAGTQVGQTVVFATTTNLAVQPSDTTAIVNAVCAVTGSATNGYVAGQINGLINPVANLNIVLATNTTTTAGGTDTETDDAYRERIVLASESFSTAGPTDAYVYWARSASADIVDVAVVYPQLQLQNGALVSTNTVQPGCVDLYVLTTEGKPSDKTLAEVLAACSATNRRPLTDYVQALSPVEVDYEISAELTLYNTADAATALSQANAAVANYVASRESSLGLDIVREQIIGVLNGPTAYGVYKVNLTAPTQDQVLDDTQWGHCTKVTITIVGTIDG